MDGSLHGMYGYSVPVNISHMLSESYHISTSSRPKRDCLETYDGQLRRGDTQGRALASAHIRSCTEVHTQADTHTCECMHTHKKNYFRIRK